ncbi:MAG TPA: hypothetical protein VLH35_01485, partial [Candidatus Acidoferrales bacterium]|nr:hypothetical protein [Candidatus Acidoferrales bacterium]
TDFRGYLFDRKIETNPATKRRTPEIKQTTISIFGSPWLTPRNALLIAEFTIIVKPIIIDISDRMSLLFI